MAWLRPPHPFCTTVAVGAVYAVLLAAGHQLLWEENPGTGGPALGGGLDGLGPAAQEGVLRTAAVSSIVTGTLTGAVAGAMSALLCRLMPPVPRKEPQRRTHRTQAEVAN